MVESVDCATAISEEVLRVAQQDPRLCLVNNDSAETHAALEIQRVLGPRFVDVGIAEQNLVGVAIGLANGGWTPVVYSAACFLAARALEQIRNAAYTRAHVVFCGFVSGMAYGSLGGTHHATEDLAWTRAVPHLRVLSPASALDAVAAVDVALEHDGPTYIRVPSKLDLPEVFAPGRAIDWGVPDVLHDGTDVGVVATGVMTSRALAAARRLSAEGVSVRVVNLSSLDPVDEEALHGCLDDLDAVVVAEDHVRAGGLMGLVSEVVGTRRWGGRLAHLGVPATFAPIGPADYLYGTYGLTVDGVATALRQLLTTEVTR